MNFNKPFIPLILFALISGCATTPRVAVIDEEEAFKYERQYLAKYEQVKSNYSDMSVVKWMQPSNKNMPCKVYVNILKGAKDRTLDGNYNIYWDGQCKNGYAYGLGREFEKGTILDMEALAIYNGKQEQPKYYIQKYHLANVTQEGDFENKFYVVTTINEEKLNFNVTYRYGYFGSNGRPALITQSSPFSDRIFHIKAYPNYGYRLTDRSKDEFQNVNFTFHELTTNGVNNGFAFATLKTGATNAGEYINGQFVRQVQLPNSFFTKASVFQSEIKTAGQKAIDAQRYALKVKKQYLNNICKPSVTVSFISDKKYKQICDEREYFSNLKNKIDAKLTRINNAKQHRRDQLNQQELVNAQISQANAAQRQANAATRSASAAEQANSIQSSQNLNNNLQMQQLNNNLMYMRMGY